MSPASPKIAAWKGLTGFQAHLQQCPKDQIPAMTAHFLLAVLTTFPPPPHTGRHTPCRGSLLPRAHRTLTRIPDARLSCRPAPCSRCAPPQVVGTGTPLPLPVPLRPKALPRCHSRDPRPARPSAQPSLVPSWSPWLPAHPEGGLAASGATSPRKPHRANDCRGPGEARPALSRSYGRTRGVH